MTRPCKSAEESAEYYAVLSTWSCEVPPGMKIKTPRHRRQLYKKLMSLGNRRNVVYCAVCNELRRARARSRWDWPSKEADDLIEAWADAQLGIDSPLPQTPLEELLHEHHRLLWAEWNLCDEIEKRYGAVHPLHDSRPDSVARPCPYEVHLQPRHRLAGKTGVNCELQVNPTASRR